MKVFDFFKARKSEAEPQDGLGNFLIVGLGNPGKEYKDSRHNAGFMVIDALAKKLEMPLTRVQSSAIVASKTVEGNRIVLAKPQTYMNNSGNSVSALVKFYKVEHEHLMVINDDIDLPFGVLRMRPGGGSAGQKGLQSIIERLGTKDFPRLRVGVGRPAGAQVGAGYVLKGFSRQEAMDLEFVLHDASDAVLEYIRNGLESAMNKYNKSILED